jgi:ArsR family transcriptional regulator, arsenate/arsenite/antimonite-responsive transcriptional repressor
MPRLIDPDVKLFAALADPVRLSIVRQLAACDGICACDFTKSCNVSQPTVSHHLRVLREAGVVSSERRGSWVYYRLSPAAIGRLGAIARDLVPGDFVPAADLFRPGRREKSGALSAATRSAGADAAGPELSPRS